MFEPRFLEKWTLKKLPVLFYCSGEVNDNILDAFHLCLIDSWSVRKNSGQTHKVKQAGL